MAHPSEQITLTLVATLVTVTALMFGAGPAMAQSPQPVPPGSPGASGPRTTLASVEGTVRKVDPAAGKVQVSSGLFGLFGTTLDVTSDTQIQVEGRQTSLADIREGDKVKASYEVREGQSIAKSIRVTPAPESRRAPVQGLPRATPSASQ